MNATRGLLIVSATCSLLAGCSDADDSRALAELLGAFGDTKYFWQQGEVAEELVALGDRRAIPPMEAYLDHPERMRKCNAAFVMAGLGDERGLEIIIEELFDTTPRPTNMIRSNGNPYVEGQILQDRYYAALLLGKLKNPKAVPALIDATRDETIHYRAAISLGEIGDARAIPALHEMLDNFPSERVWAGYGLAAVGDKEGAEILVAAALTDAHWLQRRHAVELLGKLGRAEHVPTLLRALNDENMDVRVFAAISLGEIGDPSALPALTKALKGWPTSFRDAAREAIEAIKAKNR